MKEIVINNQYGGFGLSHQALIRYAELKGFELDWYFDDINKEAFKRSHPGVELTPENSLIIHYFIKGKDKEKDYFAPWDIPRDDPALVQVVKELGDKANGYLSHLVVVEIPNNVQWEIEEYDGLEWVSEKHRTWPPQD